MTNIIKILNNYNIIQTKLEKNLKKMYVYIYLFIYKYIIILIIMHFN